MTARTREPMDVTIASFTSEPTARMVQAALDAEDIPCFVYVTPRDLIGIDFGVSVVDILVRRSDEEQAWAIINQSA